MSTNGSAGPRLLPLKEVAAQLSIRDVRTVRRRLAELGVPILVIGRSHRVPVEALDQALARLATISPPGRSLPRKGERGTRPGTPDGEYLRSSRTPAEPRSMARSRSKVKSRRGWVETVEEGLYRNHRVSCKASRTRKPGVRCSCPWSAHVPTADGWRRQKLEGATTKSEAIAAKRLRQAQGRPLRVDDLDGTSRLTELKTRWLDVRPYAPTTRRQHESHFRCYIEPRFGSRRVCDLRRLEMEQFSKDLHEIAEARRVAKNRRNPNFVKQVFASLSTCLGAAVEWGLISANPAAGVKHRPCDPVRAGEDDEGDARKVLTRPQLERLYEEASRVRDPYKAVYWEAAHRCGGELALRVGEVPALRWTSFDLDRLRVTVERKIDRVTGEEGPTKGRERRALALTPELAQLLRKLRKLQLERGVFERQGWVFPGRSKWGRVNPETLTAKIKMLQVRTGLVDAKGKALITYHGLRHSCATLLIREGMLEVEEGVLPITLLEVSRFLGHASVSTTEKTYIHLLDGDLDRVAAVLSGSPARMRTRADRHLRAV